ncbi:MAG: hypothetical protein WCI39_02215 [Gallionellaceae bacterium]
MGKSEIVEQNWDQLYTQFKTPTGDPVVCMVHKKTKKCVYFDVKLNRLLSKQEALISTVDITGKYLACG